MARPRIKLSSVLLPGLVALVWQAAFWWMSPSEASAAETIAAAGAAVGDEPVDFGRQVQPLLARRCYACHGPDAAEGGLRLNDHKAALAELDSGERAIVPGDPQASVLLERVTSDDPDIRMPPEGKPLTAAEADLLRRWIAEGATWRGHWAFEPVASPAVPAVRDAAWVRNPIDAFILARLESRGLRPAPPADRLALVRRVYFDLIGLPPTPEQTAAFLADDRADAFERLVDELLDSPHYGERWARHWLDVVRYAETNSFERDGAKPNAWKYRDYVIRSLNDDKPYDQFLREQLAGDELPEVSVDTLTATGFYRLGLWDDEPADLLQARFDELDDLVATTGQAFLGLTFNCARCHDHKIDPIKQTEYYQLLAWFHEVQPYGIRSDQRSWNQIDISPPEVVEAHQAREQQRRQLRSQMGPIEQAGIARMPAEDQRTSEGGGRARLLAAKLRKFLTDEEWARYEALKQQWTELEQQPLPPRQSVMGVVCLPEPPETFVMLRGNPHVPGQRVEPGVPEVLRWPAPAIVPPAGSRRQSTSGRRLALAGWIASAENPLTARVMVNRIWQHHFGRGIVRTPSDFGSLGDPPTHPELLDWLAAEFVRGGWSIKSLHRLILASSAYRMSSQADERALAVDPNNDLFWRFDMRRLSAEEVRDAILAVNGRLNRQVYGPSFFVPISQEVLQGQSRPGEGWGTSSPEEQARRSIYIHVKRSLITPLLADFDFPETDVSCAARFATTQPAQALGLLNGSVLHDEADHLARRLEREAGDDTRAQVARGLELALCRPPAADEIDRGLYLIQRLRDAHGADAHAALKLFCLVLYNLNEFIYLD